jgi:pilus assembly protein CpaE
MSNKGGVGKSTLSVSVGCALAVRHPGRVLLIDVSLQLGVCATHLDLKPATTLVDALRERDRLDETLLRQLATAHDSGLHLLAAPEDAVAGSQIDDDLIARVITLARRAYDYVIVDSYPLLDRVMMSTLDLSDRAYLVGESVVPTVLGLAKLVQLLDNLGFPADRQRIILNRFTNSAGNLKAADVAERLGRPVDHLLPFQSQVIVAANLGRPYILGARRFFSGFARGVDRIVAEIENMQSYASRARSSLNGAGVAADE